MCKADYAALYPTTEITWNIEPETDFTHVTLKLLTYVLTQREYHKGIKKTSEKEAENLYNILNELLESDSSYQSTFEKREKILADKIFHDNQQLVLKKLANSWFGSLGCPSLNPWGDLNAAEKTTCIGRMLLRIMICYLKNLGYEPIVGDSFTGDTPLFIKYDNSNLIDIKPIEELIGETETDALGREYDTSEKSYKVLCRSGWAKPNYIYRHKTNKQIYRIDDEKSIIDVTEDHSLFNDKQEKIKPSEINENTKLEYYKGELGDNFTLHPKGFTVKCMAKWLMRGIIDRVPCEILNSNKSTQKQFLSYIGDWDYSNTSKTCRAGLQFLKRICC